MGFYFRQEVLVTNLLCDQGGAEGGPGGVGAGSFQGVFLNEAQRAPARCRASPGALEPQLPHL